MSDFSMLALFRVEAENQTATIHRGLLDLERDPANAALLESLMRASHSIKGAARIVKLPLAVTLAHAMEDCFSAAQRGLRLGRRHFDLLLQGADQLARIACVGEDEVNAWSEAHGSEFEALAEAIRNATGEPGATASEAAPLQPFPVEAAKGAVSPEEYDEKVLRINVGRLDSLIGLASEFLVETRRLPAFANALLRLKRRHRDMACSLDELCRFLQDEGVDGRSLTLLREARQRTAEDRDEIVALLERFEGFSRRCGQLSRQLHEEAGASRMRPFGDCTAGYPRLVRDLARDLGKEVRLDITGTNTQVDREILDKLQAPLNHLLRNAIDHGLEPPAERLSAGKSPEGAIRLDARHQAGMLCVSVSDDGRGVDLEALRAAVVRRQLVSEAMARSLGAGELLDFLYLPNFTLAERVTEISGRGVGLDVVSNTLQQVRGSVKTFTEPGQGTRFQMQLPLTLSAIRGLIVQICGEPYVFPLARVERVLALSASAVRSLEGREYFLLDGESVGLVDAGRLLELPHGTGGEAFGVVVIGDRSRRFGLAVERSLSECSLVVQALDPAIGKIQDIMAATVLDDGRPALILDVDDLLRSIDRLIGGRRLGKLERAVSQAPLRRKHVLVVDDSFTVREVERKLLENRGYRVDVAVDGMDGWNAVRTGDFDLVISDVDMPRLNGIELVSLIRKDAALKRLPVMIVSYKEREEDHRRGLEAGANYYLTKSSFQDETLLAAVETLIGEA